MPTTTITDELQPWNNIRENFRGQRDLGLLLGNGASQALWQDFGYSSLYTIACAPERTHPLTPVDQAFFEEMETRNFEAVLSALATTKMVCGHLKKEFGDVEERYQSIRTGMIEAVNTVHVPFRAVPQGTKRLLGGILGKYRYVYTTNYDLLPYWAMMETKDTVTCKDFLWGHEQSFDSADSHEWDDPGTRLLYLHGALHLYHDLNGNTKKKTFQEEEGSDLLSQFDAAGEWIPLFVSEGSYKDKLRSIRRNDYLTFAYWKLTYHRGPLVVFGHSLSNELDLHILDAMRHWKNYDRVRLGRQPPKRQIAISGAVLGLRCTFRKAAHLLESPFQSRNLRNAILGQHPISMFPGNRPDQIIADKNRLLSQLKDHEIYFFDSTTHPLGSSTLRIAPGNS